MTRRGMWALVLIVALAGAAQAALFDGLSGDELPSANTAWCICPPEPREEFAQCLLFTRSEPFQSLSFCRYHRRDPMPLLPGGESAWRPEAVQQYPDNVCPRRTGAHIRLIVRSRDDYAIDSGCWTPD